MVIFSKTLNADLQRLSNHINIFQAGAGIEEHDFVRGLQEVLLQQKSVSSKGGSAFGRSEDAFAAGPFLDGLKNLRVRDSNGRPAALLEDVENNVVSIGLGHA